MKRRKKNVPFADILNKLDSKYHNFDGDGADYDEAYDYMEGNGTPEEKLYQADPYQVVVENTSTTTALKATIFGNDKFLLKQNHGNDAAISITIGQPGVEYVELLQQSSTKPFATQFMRIESENQLQVTKFITVNQKDANGNWFQRPMNMQQFKSAYQQDKNMLDAPINEYIDGTTYWEVEVEPVTRVFYTIFPLYKVDTSATLKGREPIKNYGQARINTGGLSVVPKGTKHLR